MHPVADAESSIGALGQERTNGGTIIEDDQSHGEWGLQSFATAVLMMMDRRERTQLAASGKCHRFELIGQRAARFASIVLRWEKHVGALRATSAVELRHRIRRVQRRLREDLIGHD
jgi:hypothetical protein